MTRRLPRPHLVRIRALPRATIAVLALAIVLAAVPGATGPTAASAPTGDPGLTAHETLLALAAPAQAAQPSGGAARWHAALPLRTGRPGTRARRARPGRRPPTLRGRAQRWYARRLLDGG